MLSIPPFKSIFVGSLLFTALLWILAQKGPFYDKLKTKPLLTFKGEASFDERLQPTNHNHRAPKVLKLDWTVRQELRSPDGVEKTVYTINGLFPGPTIEARPGDNIMLTVHNELNTETTAIHFHGIRQLGSNAMDGTPGLTQCAIQPGHSFLYNFTISDQTGTFWWHSHSLSQRADGLFGGFIIHDPLKEEINIGQAIGDLRIRSEEVLSERLLLIGDWYHKNATEMLAWYRSKKSYGFEPTPETALFNGVNTVNCSRVSKFVNCDESKGTAPSISLDTRLKTRLRLVNTGNLADLEVSLGSHVFVVTEADGSKLVPFRTNSVILSPGQRYSVLLDPHPGINPKEGDSFWLKLKMSEECFNIYNAALDMEQIVRVYYGDSRTIRTVLPTKGYSIDSNLPNFDPFALRPMKREPLPAADEQIMMYVNSMKLDRLGGIPYGYVNQTSWAPLEQEPLLLRDTEDSIKNGWGDHQLVVTTDRKNAKVIELIINNLDEGPHPFHLHGHQFYPLLSHKSTWGWGMYNYTAGHTVPFDAPVLRDTFTIPRRGHVVLRYVADAPGMWLFHCHVLVHLSTGMAMIFNVRPDMVPEYELENVRNGCISQATNKEEGKT